MRRIWNLPQLSTRLVKKSSRLSWANEWGTWSTKSCFGKRLKSRSVLGPSNISPQIIKVLRTEKGEKRAEGPKVQGVKRSSSTYSMMVDGVFLSRPGTSTSLRKLKNCRPSPRQFGGLGSMGKVKGGQGVVICSSSFSGT